MFAELIESAGNALLRLDSEAVRRFKGLEGKVICLHLIGLQQEIYLVPREDRIAVRETWDGDPDVILRGTLGAFTQLGLRGLDVSLFSKGKIEIEGDIELGTRFQKIVEDLEFDWEELLSQYVGDIPAHQIGNAVRGTNRLKYPFGSPD